MTTIYNFIMSHKGEILLAIPFVTRAYYGLMKGGGLVGLWRGLMFGTNEVKK